MMSPLEAQIILAKRGNRAVLPDLRKSLDENHELWQHYGDLSLQTQQLWIETFGGKDLYLKECALRQIEEMKKDLVGTNPSPLEKLLVERVVAAWIKMQYVECLETQAPGGEYIKLAEFRMRQQQAAHNQFLSAVKMLNIVRSTAAKTITVELRQSVAMSSPNPSVPKANGELVSTHNGVNRINGHAADMRDSPGMSRSRSWSPTPGTTAEPVFNGRMHVNGHHNRFTDVFETAQTK